MAMNMYTQHLARNRWHESYWCATVARHGRYVPTPLYQYDEGEVTLGFGADPRILKISLESRWYPNHEYPTACKNSSWMILVCFVYSRISSWWFFNSHVFTHLGSKSRGVTLYIFTLPGELGIANRSIHGTPVLKQLTLEPRWMNQNCLAMLYGLSLIQPLVHVRSPEMKTRFSHRKDDFQQEILWFDPCHNHWIALAHIPLPVLRDTIVLFAISSHDMKRWASVGIDHPFTTHEKGGYMMIMMGTGRLQELALFYVTQNMVQSTSDLYILLDYIIVVVPLNSDKWLLKWNPPN